MGWAYRESGRSDELIQCHRCGERMHPSLEILGDRETGEECVTSEKCSACGQWPYPPKPINWRELGLTWGLVVSGWTIVWLTELFRPHLFGLGVLALCACWLRALWESFEISFLAILIVSVAAAIVHFAI